MIINDGLKEQLKTKDDVLELICDIAIDYDGCKSVETIKELVDEIHCIAAYGRHLKNEQTT